MNEKIGKVERDLINLLKVVEPCKGRRKKLGEIKTVLALLVTTRYERGGGGCWEKQLQ